MTNINTSFNRLSEWTCGMGYEDVNIAVGLRPSGSIHLGNMSTLTLAGLLARDIGPANSNVVLTICDIDMPDKKEWNAKEYGFVRYFDTIPSGRPNYPNLLSYAREGVKFFMDGLEDELGINVEIQNLSEVQRHEGFRQGLKKLLDSQDTLTYLFSGSNEITTGSVPVHPICPKCKTSNFKPAIYDGHGLTTSCSNPDCSLVGEFVKVDLFDTTRDLAVHFFIDPLRDACVPPYAHIHVFGGDYSDAHYGNQDSKSDKILKVLEVTKPDRTDPLPRLLIGPKFYARDGSKMSKSKTNGLDLDSLRDHFEEDLVKRIVVLTDALKDYHHADFRVWDRLLYQGRPH